MIPEVHRGVHRGVYGSLFDDPDYQALTPDARLTLLTVRLCAQAGPAVIFRYYPEVLARQTGLPPRRVASALAELARLPALDSPWIVYDEAIVWVRNGLKYDPTMRMKNDLHVTAVNRAVAGLPHREIVIKFCEYYKLAKPFDSLSYGSAKAIEPSTLRVPSTEDRVPSTEKPNRSDSHAKAITFTDDEFLAALRANTAYQGIDLDAELGKMDAWLATRPGRQKTRRFIVSWLNKADKPVASGGSRAFSRRRINDAWKALDQQRQPPTPPTP